MSTAKQMIRESSLIREWQDVLIEAVEAGWNIQKQGRYWIANDPKSDHVIRIMDKASGYADGRLVRKYRRWIADSLAVVLDDGVEALAAAVSEGGTLGRAVSAGYDAYEDGDQIAADIIGRGIVRKAAEAGAAFVEGHVVEPSITRVKPWLAKRNPAQDGGRLYESEAVLERRWSDGTTDYACAFPECEYVSADKPRSVSAHYAAAHVRTGQAEAVTRNPSVAAIDPEYTEPTSTREYRPSDRLLDALSAFLEEHFDNLAVMPARDIAFGALRWMHERPDLEDVDRPNVGTRTPEQIIERIRYLVGGRDVETEERLEAAEADLRAANLRIEELEADLATAHTENARIQSDLDGLIELADALRSKGSRG